MIYTLQFTIILENTYDNLFENDLSELLWRRGLSGFKRRERLDVKKPGPPFSTNNYAFKTPSPISKFLLVSTLLYLLFYICNFFVNYYLLLLMIYLIFIILHYNFLTLYI